MCNRVSSLIATPLAWEMEPPSSSWFHLTWRPLPFRFSNLLHKIHTRHRYHHSNPMLHRSLYSCNSSCPSLNSNHLLSQHSTPLLDILPWDPLALSSR